MVSEAFTEVFKGFQMHSRVVKVFHGQFQEISKGLRAIHRLNTLDFKKVPGVSRGFRTFKSNSEMFRGFQGVPGAFQRNSGSLVRSRTIQRVSSAFRRLPGRDAR